MTRAYVEWYAGERDQTWTTPREFFRELHEEYQFTLDGAADSDNAVLPLYSTVEEPRSWVFHRVFCNPPWSDIPRFVELAPYADLAVLLVPARVNARWFHRALELGAHVRFWPGRLKFGMNGGSSPVDCLLLVFGEASNQDTKPHE